MIPKVIHYCWFSEGEKPEKIQMCIASWKKYLPDYEIKCWNYKNFPKGKSQWVDEAVEAKKFAFAADYIRCYSLYTEGGIYLDSDVEVLKSFDPLIKYPYFIGKENDGAWEAAVMGSEKGMTLYKEMLKYYDSRKFNNNGKLDIRPMPGILNEIGLKFYNVTDISDEAEFAFESKDLQILPFDFFSPKSYKTGEMNITSRTYSIHHFTASWHGKKEKLYYLIQKIFGKSTAKTCSSAYKKLKSVIKKD